MLTGCACVLPSAATRNTVSRSLRLETVLVMLKLPPEAVPLPHPPRPREAHAPPQRRKKGALRAETAFS